MTNMNIEGIKTHEQLQPRVEMDQTLIDEYADAVTNGAKFPAVTVFQDSGEFWLADGYHRLAAFKKIGALDIPVEIHQGTFREAVLFSISANATHGKRRTNEDKRKAVMTLLSDMEWGNWSDSEIARKTLVSQQYVNKLRHLSNEPLSYNNGMITPDNPEVTQEKQFTRNGKTYTMNTENIGKALQRREEAAVEPEEEEEKIIRSPVVYQGKNESVDELEDIDDYEDEEEDENDEVGKFVPMPRRLPSDEERMNKLVDGLGQSIVTVIDNINEFKKNAEMIQRTVKPEYLSIRYTQILLLISKLRDEFSEDFANIAAKRSAK